MTCKMHVRFISTVALLDTFKPPAMTERTFICRTKAQNFLKSVDKL